ncbi:P-loop containing nucleoside triphosphate hydrolase protein [Mycena olivaceomarginata]|nr:P-loop containing nucleoside triphosphate hydrolase protein [Mycena olivaceomarginata]KAJ7803632.1 P-loop containing nucleoside triphosphate hydrolase protein [Mycena olivaceomarginata]
MASPAWHHVLKFIITGDAAVGKSSLLVRLTDQRFLSIPDPTVRTQFGLKLITLPGPEATVVKLQCWDTAGTESFRSITRSYYRGAAGACRSLHPSSSFSPYSPVPLSSFSIHPAKYAYTDPASTGCLFV